MRAPSRSERERPIIIFLTIRKSEYLRLEKLRTRETQFQRSFQLTKLIFQSLIGPVVPFYFPSFPYSQNKYDKADSQLYFLIQSLAIFQVISLEGFFQQKLSLGRKEKERKETIAMHTLLFLVQQQETPDCCHTHKRASLRRFLFHIMHIANLQNGFSNLTFLILKDVFV